LEDCSVWIRSEIEREEIKKGRNREDRNSREIE